MEHQRFFLLLIQACPTKKRKEKKYKTAGIAKPELDLRPLGATRFCLPRRDLLISTHYYASADEEEATKLRVIHTLLTIFEVRLGWHVAERNIT